MAVMGGRRCAWLGVLVLLAPSMAARAAGPEETIKPDCGVNALFILLRVEGRAVLLEALISALPPRHPDGYSMAELSAAAKSFGLELEGIRFGPGDKALERSAIAFLKSAKGGHYVVLRPVGSTGTMVQVIDPPNAPWIADYDRIFAVKSWTNRIIYPRRGWLGGEKYVLLVVCLSALLLIIAFRRRLQPCGLETDCGAL